jgi:hypothetical protein
MGYVVYVLVVLAGFALWGLLFWYMRSGSAREHRDTIGYAFIGPLHKYLQKRNYALTRREIWGWLVVLVVLLVAPLITHLLEGG